MADNQQQQIDHYDFINAPQFVDFSDLAAQDDPDADKFFETHREEDDFMLPLDINAISPTVQLLYDNEDYENQHYSDEANKAAMAAGLEDVKIEYYASPQQQSGLSQPSSGNKKKSLNSVYGTPSGGTSGLSSLSSATSFYTPTGDAEDKENLTPVQSAPSSLTKFGSFTKSGVKSIDAEIVKQENNLRSILGDYINSTSQFATPAYTSPGEITTIKKISTGPSATHSLMSRLNELSLVSSDEEEYNDEDNQSNMLPTSQSVPDQENSPTLAESTYSTFNSGKMDFFSIPQANEVPTVDIPETNDSCELSDVTLVLQGLLSSNETAGLVEDVEAGSESESDDELGGTGSIELGTHINNILRKLDAELQLDDQDEDDQRCSILVAPKVGEQVHWTAVEEMPSGKQSNGIVELNVSYEVESVDEEATNGHNGIAAPRENESILDFYGLSEFSVPTVYQFGRASSVGDLAHAVELVEPKNRQFETYGYNPRVGITIPKTPDVAGSFRDEVKQMQTNNYNSNKNACYFEIEAPKPTSRSVRRVSSCSDLINLQKNAKLGVSRASKIPPKRKLTVPRTPDTMKRAQKYQIAQSCASTASSTASTSYKYNGASFRSSKMATIPNVSERLAAAKSRAPNPMKGSHYVSMAEAMINYQKSTPDRFRSLPKGRVVPEKRPASCDSRRRADPSPARSPDIPDVHISRPSSRASSIPEKRTNIRSAAPAPSASGPVLPKRAEFKPTIPKPFNFRSGNRSRPATAVPNEEADYKFKARPVPSKLLNDTTASGSSKFRTLTQPMSPHFASDALLRDRQRKRTQVKPSEAKPTNAVKSTCAPRTSRIPTNSTTTTRHPLPHPKPTLRK